MLNRSAKTGKKLSGQVRGHRNGLARASEEAGPCLSGVRALSGALQAKKDKYKAFAAGSAVGKAFGKEPKAKVAKPAIKGRVAKKTSKAGAKPSKGGKKKFKKGK
jgi:hypothetical protein